MSYPASPYAISIALIVFLSAMTACSPPEPKEPVEKSPLESTEGDEATIPSPPAGFDAVPVPEDNPSPWKKLPWASSSSSIKGSRPMALDLATPVMCARTA